MMEVLYDEDGVSHSYVRGRSSELSLPVALGYNICYPGE